MQRINIAAFGTTLALASTALWATSFDATRGTYDDGRTAEPPRVEVAPIQRAPTVYERQPAPEAREELATDMRTELAPEPETRELVAAAPTTRLPHYDPRHPHTGQLIDRGLFNRTGPNDFGA